MSKKNKFYEIIIFIIILVLFIWFVETTGKGPSKKKYKFDKYELQFDKDFKKGLTTVDNLGISILIAVDCSGSMADYPEKGHKAKYKIASESLEEIINFLENYYNKLSKEENFILKVGILTFSHDVWVLFPLTNMNHENFYILKNKISDEDNFKPSSTTAIGKTIEKGVEILLQSETIFKSLIVITDGENTEGVHPVNVVDAVINNRNNKSTKDFPINTSSILLSIIGFDIDTKVFEKLNDMGVRILSAYDQKELIESLKKVISADITKLEAI